MPGRISTHDSYIRVSKTGGREGERYQTVDDQRKIIADLAQRHGISLAEEVVEEDVSGSRAAKDRGLERLILRCESGESAGILVAFQDRLSRGSLLEQAQLWERLGRAGARLLTGDGLDSADPQQEVIFNLRAAVARDQWVRYRDGFRRSAANSVERGVHHCVYEPFGYRFASENNRRLEPDPETAPHLREMFERRIAGESYASLARWLKTKGHDLSPQGLCRTLANDAYLGVASYGDIRNEEAHEPLVTRLTFDRVQAGKTTQTRKGKSGVISERSLTVGIAVCSECGKRLASSLVRAEDIQLRCLNPHHAPVVIQGKKLDQDVERRVMTWQRRAKGLKFNLPEKRVGAAADLEAAQYALDLFLDNLEALTFLGKEKWNTQARKHSEAVENARARLIEEEERADADVTYTRLGDRWDDASTPERRDMLRRIINVLAVAPAYGKRGVPLAERVSITLSNGSRA